MTQKPKSKLTQYNRDSRIAYPQSMLLKCKSNGSITDLSKIELLSQLALKSNPKQSRQSSNKKRKASNDGGHKRQSSAIVKLDSAKTKKQKTINLLSKPNLLLNQTSFGRTTNISNFISPLGSPTFNSSTMQNFNRTNQSVLNKSG